MASRSGTGTNRALLTVLVLVIIGAGAVYWRAHHRPAVVTTVRDDVGDIQRIAPPATNPATAAFRRLCAAKELAADGKFAEALPIFEQLAKSEANSSYGWDAEIQASLAVGHLGRHDEALGRLDQIAAGAPVADERPVALLAKAEVLGLAGRHEAAVQLYRQIVFEHQRTNLFACEEALEGLAHEHATKGEYGLMRATLARLIEDYPGDEDSRRRAAERATERLTSKVAERQEPRIAQLVATGKYKVIEKLGRGPTVLKAEEGPYLVTRLLRAESGDVLTIEAGTVVRFSSPAGLQIAGGRLTVAGTAEKPVQLLPLGDDPAQDYWLGIEVASDATPEACRLAHCQVRGADPGLQLNAGQALLEQCRFDRCGRVSVRLGSRAVVTMSQCAITDGYRLAIECLPRATLRAMDCRLSGLITDGVVLRSPDDQSRLEGCTIEHCGGDGILLRGRGQPAIQSCQMLRNAGTGLRAVDGASCTIVASRLVENGDAGVRLMDGWAGVMRDSTIAGNRIAGVLAEARCTGQISGNVIERNDGVGLGLRLDCSMAVFGNRIVDNNTIGLLLEDSQPASLRDNQITGNREAALRNASGGPVDAANNWWGSAEEASVKAVIQDQATNTEWGQVRYRPWLTTRPAQ